MAYLDGEVQPERATVVQAHVAGCSVCQRLSGELRTVSRDMARWQVEDAPATMKAPAPPQGRDQKVWSGFGWLRARPAIAFSLSAAAVVVCVGLVSYGRLLIQSEQGSTRASRAYAMSDARVDTRLSGEAGGAGQSTVGIPNFEPEAMQRQAGDARFGSEASLIVTRQSGARPPATVPQPGPSIARTARLSVMTADFDAARRLVDRVVTDTGGLVGKVTVSRTRSDARSLSATLLIPATRLDAALTSLKAIGLVLEEFQGGDDVTEQVVDVEARLANARNTEKRLVELLQKRTGDLADVLAAEREIARVREEIERHDAQRKNLERRVTYATLMVEVTEEHHAVVDLGPRPVSGRFRDAFVTGVSDALDSALGFGVFLVRVGPILAVWIAVIAVLVWPIWAVLRWKRGVG